MSSEVDRFAHPRVAAGVLFRDEQGGVLVVKPTYKAGWDIPGGYVEDGESPRTAAIREVREELGLDVNVGRLLVVDWAPHPDEGDKLLFIFDGGHLTPESTNGIQLSDRELSEARFVASDQLAALMPPRLARRVLNATDNQNDVYLEHGTVIN